MRQWSSEVTQMVATWAKDSGKQLVETVMSSENPAMLKFSKNDIVSLLNHTVIGFLTTVPVEKKELTTIREEEVRFVNL